MNKNSRIALGVLAAVVVIGLLWVLLAPGPSDKEQIQAALANAVKASKEGRAGGVLEYLSDSISVNGTKYQAGSQVADAIRKWKPDVKVQTMEPVINGDKATITSDVDLSIAVKTITIPSVTFEFGKQPGHKWLVLPSNDWKLEGISLPQQSVDAIAAQVIF